MDVLIDCICSGAPHRQDTVTLRDKLDYAAAVAIKWTVAVFQDEHPGGQIIDSLAVLSEQYLLRGIESWSLVDELGDPVKVTPESIPTRLLSNVAAAMAVGDVAEALYNPVVLLPLLKGAATSSPPSSTNGSTSATNGHSPRPRKPSKRSSTSTTPTDDTAMTSESHAGDSSYSLSVVSASS